MSVNVQIIRSYKHYGRCLSLSNGALELYVTLDVGPRIISLTLLPRGENLLWNDDEQKMVVSNPKFEQYFGQGRRFCFYGGHRIWMAPQHEIRTAVPDNDPVSWVELEDGVVLSPNVMDPPGVRPKLVITMDNERAEFQVEASYTATSQAPQEFALWQITQMAPGGLAVVPFHRGARDLDKVIVPSRTLSIFDITDVHDPRFYLGNDYLTLRQDPTMRAPFKVGTLNREGWAMYINRGAVVTKRFGFQEDVRYTDGGVNCELYTGSAFLEVESLGELNILAAGDTVSHCERFTVQPALLPTPGARDEQAIDDFVKAHQ